MPKYEICNVQVYCSLLTSNYHFYMQSQIFKCTVLYWHPIITFTCNLKFSSVLFSTDIQLSLLHAISNFQVYCSLLTSNYHFYMQSEIFKCNVLYLPPIITFYMPKYEIWHPIITFTCNLKISSVMFANNHFYMPKYEIWNVQVYLSLLYAIWNFQV